MEPETHYGVVRVFKPGSYHGLYDIVKHEPGYADTIVARSALYADAVAIVNSMNATLKQGSFW